MKLRLIGGNRVIAEHDCEALRYEPEAHYSEWSISEASLQILQGGKWHHIDVGGCELEVTA